MFSSLRRAKIITILIAAALYFAAFFVCASYSGGYVVGSDSFYAFMLLTAFFLLAWGLTMVYRVQTDKQHFLLLAIVVLCYLWQALRFVKWLSNDELIAEYADYAYFLPMTALPILVFWLTADIFFPSLPRKKPILYAFLFFGTALFLLAMTNRFHHLVYDNVAFSSDPEHSAGIIHMTYTRGKLYFLFSAFQALTIGGAFAMLLLGSVKHAGLWQILLSSVAFSLPVTYIVLYMLRIPFFVDTTFIKDASLMMIIFLYLFLETIMQVGLVQNNGQYLKNFRRSRLPACVFDETGAVLYRNEEFFLPAYYGENKRDFRYSVKSIGLYSVAVQENLSTLFSLQRKIEKENAELSDANDLLHDVLVATGEQAAVKARLQLTEEIERSIGKTKTDAESLTALLPDKKTDENADECKKTLGYLALDLGYMKQKCMLLLGAKERKKMTFDAFSLLLNVISHDIKSVGYAEVGYSVKPMDEASFSFATEMNDFLNAVARAYAFSEADLYVVADVNNASCVVEVAKEGLLPRPVEFDGKFTVSADEGSVRIRLEVEDA